MYSSAELSQVSRKDLQALAKQHGLKANKKSAILIEELLEIFGENKAESTKSVPSELLDDCVDSCADSAPVRKSPSPEAPPAGAGDAEPPVPELSALSPIQSKRSPSLKARLSNSCPNSPFATGSTCDQQDVDESISSLQERSFRNLTMNIDQFGRISVSSPSEASNECPETSTFVSTTPSRGVAATRDASSSTVSKKPRKSEVKTPAKSHPAIIPKSNKTQRLRREALEKKKERLTQLENKAPLKLSVSLNSRPGASMLVAPKMRPSAAAAPRQSATKRQSLGGQVVVVDSEVSFNIGASKTPIAKPLSTAKVVKNNKSGARVGVPDFKKMHSAQFSAQKSITAKVARDNTLTKKFESAISQALSGAAVPENKENKPNMTMVNKPTNIKSRGIPNAASSSDLKQKKFLQSGKAKREALQQARFRS